jgi:hypothetical protein
MEKAVARVHDELERPRKGLRTYPQTESDTGFSSRPKTAVDR